MCYHSLSMLCPHCAGWFEGKKRHSHAWGWFPGNCTKELDTDKTSNTSWVMGSPTVTVVCVIVYTCMFFFQIIVFLLYSSFVKSEALSFVHRTHYSSITSDLSTFTSSSSLVCVQRCIPTITFIYISCRIEQAIFCPVIAELFVKTCTCMYMNTCTLLILTFNYYYPKQKKCVIISCRIK